MKLESLLDGLRNPDLTIETDYSLAEKYLEAARLSREVERPRAETERLLLQARELASRNGSRAQQLRTIYEHAWTTFWWFDDVHLTNKIYPQAEALAKDADDASDIELLGNLWMVLKASFDRGVIDRQDGDPQVRLGVLLDTLSRLAGNSSRPSNALYAEGIASMLSLTCSIRDRVRMSEILKILRSCLRRSEGLGMYPARHLFDLILELGDFIRDVPEYDRLFDDAQAVEARREGEVATGARLLRRGYQLIQQERHLDAVVALAKARELLAKRECLLEACGAQLGCAICYERLGLFWAARREATISFHQAMFLAKGGHLPQAAIRAASRLVWLELQLGRIPHVLAWSRIVSVLTRAFIAQGDTLPNLEEEHENQDLVLGILFLRANLDELSHLTRLRLRLPILG